MNLELINLPDEIIWVMDTIEQNGYEAYVVGGAVRDFLMRRSVSDYDITTNARPEEISKMFPKVFETGIKHGTVTVLTDRFAVEVTSYRVDGEYQNHRRPKNVAFSNNLSDDLKRRDFTINALAYNKSNFVDLFGGAEDIKNKIIRTVGDADERFSEDALRMLRAVRFSACLGFCISPEVRASIEKNAHLIKYISKERIKVELSKAILGEYVDKLSENASFISMFLPHFEESKDVVYEIATAEMDAEIRWAILLKKAHPNAEDFLNKYKFSNAEKKKILTLIEYYDVDLVPEKTAIKGILRKMDTEFFECVLKMKRDTKVEDIYRDIINSGEPYRIRHLAIDGSDILDIAKDKTKIGSMLDYLLDRVIRNPEKNNREDLFKLLEEYHV